MKSRDIYFTQEVRRFSTTGIRSLGVHGPPANKYFNSRYIRNSIMGTNRTPPSIVLYNTFCANVKSSLKMSMGYVPSNKSKKKRNLEKVLGGRDYVVRRECSHENTFNYMQLLNTYGNLTSTQIEELAAEDVLSKTRSEILQPYNSTSEGDLTSAMIKLTGKYYKTIFIQDTSGYE